jgi:HK97 family phage major capsid protein
MVKLKGWVTSWRFRMPVKHSRAASHAVHLYRYAKVDPTSGDEKERTFQVAFSSEHPVPRKANDLDVELGACSRKGEKYLEVLSHAAGDYDISPMNNSGALLDEHQEQFHLGNIKHAEVSTDLLGRAMIWYDGITDLSKTRAEQMRSGSRPHVSFGYFHTRFLGDMKLPDGRSAKRFAWLGDEISSVSSPADPKAGKHRSAGDLPHCLHCGQEFDDDDLDKDGRCADCGPVARALKDRIIRAADKDVSANDLGTKVATAAEQDDRFTGRDDKGTRTGWVQVQDLTHDGTNWSATLNCSKDGKKYEVPVAVADDGAVKLGAEKRSEVDLNKFVSEPGPEKKNNLRTKPMELDEKSIRANERATAVAELTPEIQKTTRATVVAEFQTQSAAQKTKRTTLRNELHPLADAFIKDHGTKWVGDTGNVQVLGERIRALEQEAYDAPEDHTLPEIRTDFKVKVQDLISRSRAPKKQEEAAMLPDKLASRCSLGNVFRAASEASQKGNRSSCFIPTSGAEKEANDELRRAAADFPGGLNIFGEGGLHLPMNMPSGLFRKDGRSGRMTRDALATDFPTAGALITPQFIWPMIDLLRNMPALSRLGMVWLSGVVGNLVLPRQEAATIAQWLPEGAQLTAYDQVLGQIKMSPHRVGSRQNYSRLALIQTTPDFEAMVIRDHMAVIALAIDEAGINGQGAADQPLGILNQPGIGSVAFGGAAATAYARMVAMETAIRKSNIYDPVSFLSTSVVRGTLRVTPATLTGSTVVSGSTNSVWTTENGEENVIGRPAVDSQQVPGDIMIAIAANHLIGAQWGGLAVVLDTLSRADFDEYKLSINTYVDFALRHPQAVCRSADSLAVLT